MPEKERRMRSFALIGALFFTLAPAWGQTAPPMPPVPSVTRVAPSDDSGAIRLYPGEAPGEPVRQAEVWNLMGDKRVVRNVSVPTITPFLPPPGKETGAAVIVVPGGGFKALAIEGEGWPTARWLADQGIAAFVLKYRLNETPADEAAFMRQTMATMAAMAATTEKKLELQEPRATADALQALKVVRQNAARWNVDPTKVGMIGFSAGAVATLEAATTADVAARPAFFGHIYGPMVAIAVPAHAPPMFTAIAIDDPLFASQGFGIVDSWRNAGRPVELHAFETGGHGFGIGKPGTTTMLMMPQFRAWLEGRGLLGKPR
jgi:acetyl esterase/lipase